MAMLVLNLAKRGHESHVFALQPEGPLCKVLSDAGIAVHDGGYPFSGSTPQKLILLLRAFFRLWWLAIKLRPNVVHAYLPFTNFMGAVVGRAALIPVVISSRRGLGTHQDRHPGWKWFDRIANSLSTRITVNSRAVAEDTVRRDGVQPEKLVCIYNGLDCARFQVAAGTRARIRDELGVLEGEFLWVKVANLIPYKGHADLLRAFSGLPAYGKLALVGEDRGIQAALEAQARELGIIDRVIFLGLRRDIPELLSAMDGYVMASHEEGFSNAILEAMAAGLPIVATDVGGNREALQDGKLGLIVSAHNPDALSRAMSELMADRELRARFSGQVARAAKELYSIDAMVDAHLKLYGCSSGK